MKQFPTIYPFILISFSQTALLSVCLEAGQEALQFVWVMPWSAGQEALAQSFALIMEESLNDKTTSMRLQYEATKRLQISRPDV